MGFAFKGHEENVLKLKKALYGLKQAPRAWNSRIDKFMTYYLGLEVKQMDNNIFVSQESYAKKVLEKFKMFDYNFVNIPMEGSMKLSKFDSGGEKEDPTLFISLVGSLRQLTSFSNAAGEVIFKFIWSLLKEENDSVQ
ncbi:putative mitochondrial protein, partial [Mucuna pruriens]